MAMGIKWRTTFMSVGNTKYIVDIYKDGWTGSVTELTPATDALTIEEEDDSDLLTVIRYKTGYVSVMADDSTDVADIFPTGILDRPVRVTEVVGNTQRVIFHGYVQVQEFNRYGNYATTGNPPDVVQIPVISPLGLIYDIDFDKVTTPQDYTLLAVLDYGYGLDVALLKKNVCDCLLHIGSGNIYCFVLCIKRVSNTRKHICNNVCHFYILLYQLAFFTPGIWPLYANSLKQIRQIPYLRSTACGRPQMLHLV